MIKCTKRLKILALPTPRAKMSSKGVERLPSEKALLHAFIQNWEQIRHYQLQRLHLLGFYATILAALTVLAPYILTFNIIRAAPFFFLFCLSFFVYGAFLKCNAELANHTAAVHWISEKLRLIKKMDDEKRSKLVEEARLKNIKGIFEFHLFDTSYIALPLPIYAPILRIPLSVLGPLIATSLSLCFATGLLIYDILNIMLILPYEVVLTMTINTSIMGACLMGIHCYRLFGKVWDVTLLFIKFRKPKEIASWGLDEYTG